jgi:ribosomal protein S18 acetylase RimI-like enzyme
VHVRPATEADSLDILAWRNDPLTRAMSKNSAEVDQQSHLVWFAKAVRDPARKLLIGELDGAKIGMVRFDQGADGRWLVSINVAPGCRGKGHGRTLLRLGTDALRGLIPEASLLAEVRADNRASLAIFRACGYRPEAEENGVFRLIYEP